MNKTVSLGILAYGSLIDDPGEEISNRIVQRIDCVTPFSVEFARMSKSRDNAPTLIPVEDGGMPVQAQVLLLDEKVSLTEAKNMLWRRETRTIDPTKIYRHNSQPGKNTVVIKILKNFYNIKTVLYTSIASNLGLITGDVLAKLAIDSFFEDAGNNGMDGIHYLLHAKENGIKTELSDEYENAILNATGTKNLEEAIRLLSKKKPDVVKLRQEEKDFEDKVKAIGDLIHSYGLKKTLAGRQIEPEKFKTFLKDNRQEFLENVHEGFKKGQNEILQQMLLFEKEKLKLKSAIKASKPNDRTTRKEILETISRIEYKESILRHLIDSIAWQLIKGQLYISRRLYQGVKGEKRLLKSNILSVIASAAHFNRIPENFALITDLSAYIQLGDLLLVSGDTLTMVEVKEGRKNHEVLKIMEDVFNSEDPVEEILSKVTLDGKFAEQLDRNFKQFGKMINFVSVVNTDKGIDSEGRNIRIITPKERTPRFDEQLHKLYEELKKRDFWAYDVIDDCLHIGLYHGPLRFAGPGILESIAKYKKFNYILVNFLHIVKSLNKPLFFLPFPQEFIYDILFRRVDLYFMLDLDSFLKLFSEFNMTAKWVSRKETMKIVKENKGREIFVHKNQCISVTHNVSKKSMYLSIGILNKIYFEHIYPSYAAYTILYYFSEVE